MYKPLGNCLDCKHFYFYGGSPSYSEYTPGSDMSFGCNHNFWDSSDCYDQDDFSRYMQMANDCKSYEPKGD